MVNKKGDVSEGITFIVVIFFLAVSLLIAAFVNDKLKNIVEDTPLNSTTASASIISGMNKITTTGVQQGFTLIFSFLIIGMMLSSFMTRVHPAWLFLYIIFLAFAVIMAAPLANTYNVLANTDAIKSVADQQTQINWIMQHSIKILIGAVALSMVILFAKLPENNTI